MQHLYKSYYLSESITIIDDSIQVPVTQVVIALKPTKQIKTKITKYKWLIITIMEGTHQYDKKWNNNDE